jgi:hypothetical protein
MIELDESEDLEVANFEEEEDPYRRTLRLLTRTLRLLMGTLRLLMAT